MFKKMRKIEQALASQSFVHYVHKSNAADVAYWAKWIEAHPEHRDLVERAVLVVKSLQFNTDLPGSEQAASNWILLQKRIQQEAYSTGTRSAITSQRVLLMVAGFIGIVLATLFWFKWYYNPIVSFETDIAQHATLNLPDGSEVRLNKNSQIRFYKSWDQDTVRKVWLDGEAHFKVRPQPRADGSYRRFEVHTTQLLINVVGTVFSVNTKEGDYVLLESGRVDIQKKGDKHTYTLKPGQSAQINATGELVMSNTSTKPLISWVDGKILLNNNTLEEIIAFMEESYGLQVECSQEQLLQRRLSGKVRLDSIDDLLNVLEKVLDLVIIRDGDAVKIVEINKHNIHV